MKKIYTAILLVTWMCHGAEAQRWGAEVGMSYAYTSPMGSMQRYIKDGHGAVVDFGMLTPSKRFALGMEVQYTMYGHDESLQEYEFSDGTRTDMDIVVNNSFMNFMAYARYYVITEGKFLPYLSVKGGYASYSTDLTVYDPEDPARCTPSHREILLRDGSMVASMGAGFRLDMSSVFRKSEPGKFYIDFNSSLTQGGTARFMNSDAPDLPPSNNQNTTDVARAEFVNPQEQIIHKYHVGNVYSSVVQMLDFRLGAVFRFAR